MLLSHFVRVWQPRHAAKIKNSNGFMVYHVTASLAEIVAHFLVIPITML